MKGKWLDPFSFLLYSFLLPWDARLNSGERPDLRVTRHDEQR